MHIHFHEQNQANLRFTPLLLLKFTASMFNSSNWFREWFNSPYYHKLYFEHDEKEASAFITRLLNQLKPAPEAKPAANAPANKK